MRWPRVLTAAGLLSGVLTAGICVSVVVLIWFAYHAVQLRLHSERQLAERRARETVDTVATALIRDMHGVQHAVLPSLWDELARDSPTDVRSHVASAFARYPYPESFVVWRSGMPDGTMPFYMRADRRPGWAPAGDGPAGFPVSVARVPRIERAIRGRIESDARQGRPFSIFQASFDGEPYQVVARLYYRDVYRERLEGIVGFTVNVSWARRHYFPAVASQVANILGGMPFAIVDEHGELVAGTTRPSASAIRRSLPTMFFDPLLASIDLRADLPRGAWAVLVDPEPELAAASTDATRTFAIAAISAATLAVGLILTARAARASARLADMRADFVSTVTHDLKTPIATIRAIGDTIVRGRVSDGAALRDYAQIVVQESKRLTRLVENLLAYSRVTDITEVYAFEPLALDALVDDVLQGFRGPIAEGGFDVQLDVSRDLPPVRADATAIRLALDNVVDNAIRYSGTARWLAVTGSSADGALVSLRVADRGVGIASDEIAQVTRKFFRGRRSGTTGTGLGLAIANRIVTDHGGRMTIESRPGGGTTVEIAIPAMVQGDEEAHPHR
jgi:signal transduction histidine kinase